MQQRELIKKEESSIPILALIVKFCHICICTCIHMDWINVDKLIFDTLTLVTLTSLGALIQVLLESRGWLVIKMAHPKTRIGLHVLPSMVCMRKEES
mgnify:CR=1 FL=1